MKKILCILSLLFGVSACQAPDQLASLYGDEGLRTQLASHHRPDSSNDTVAQAEKGMADMFRQEINLTSPEGGEGAERQNLSILHTLGEGSLEDIGRVVNVFITQYFNTDGHVASLSPGATGPAMQRGRLSPPKGVVPQTEVELEISGKYNKQRRKRARGRKAINVELEVMGKKPKVKKRVKSDKEGSKTEIPAVTGVEKKEKPKQGKSESGVVDEDKPKVIHVELELTNITTKEEEKKITEEIPTEEIPVVTKDIPEAKKQLDLVFYLRTKSATRPAITGDSKNPHDMCLYHFGSIAKEYDFLEHFNHLDWQASFSFYSDNADLLPLAVNNRVDTSDLAIVNSPLSGRKEWAREHLLKRQGVDPISGWDRGYDYVLSYNEYKSRLRERIFQFTLHPIYLRDAFSGRIAYQPSTAPLNTKESVKDPLLGLDDILTSKPHGAIRDNSQVVVLVFGTEFLTYDQRNYTDERWEDFFEKHENVSVIFVNPLAFREDAFGRALSHDYVRLANLCNVNQHPTKASMLELVNVIKDKF